MKLRYSLALIMAFTEVLDYGQGVTEYQRDGVAAGQIKGLLEWIS